MRYKFMEGENFKVNVSKFYKLTNDLFPGTFLNDDTHSKIRKVCEKFINLTSSKHNCIFVF